MFLRFHNHSICGCTGKNAVPPSHRCHRITAESWDSRCLEHDIHIYLLMLKFQNFYSTLRKWLVSRNSQSLNLTIVIKMYCWWSWDITNFVLTPGVLSIKYHSERHFFIRILIFLNINFCHHVISNGKYPLSSLISIIFIISPSSSVWIL